MLIDTHCHINMMVKKKFDVLMNDEELQAANAILKNALSNEVTTIINVGTSLEESTNCVELARTYTECFAAVGIHPNDAQESWHKELKEMESRWFKNNDYKDFFKIVGIGEIGLDKHYPGYNLARQIDCFRAQIEWALQYNLPIIIHTRDAQDMTLKIIDEYKNDNLRGVIHCFSEDQAFADEALRLGFKLGIGGTLTYPKSERLREVFKSVPLESIVLETDSPFLPPQIIRGKQNSPAQIKTIAEYVAELRGISFKEVAKSTTANAQALFNL